MLNKKDFGLTGEQYAVSFLINEGYTILAQNWRSGRKEIDIIVIKDFCLVFIEVKTRASTKFGYPETAVDKAKAKRIVQAAESYLEQEKPNYKRIRFDVIALIITKGEVKDFKHVEDAFY